MKDLNTSRCYSKFYTVLQCLPVDRRTQGTLEHPCPLSTPCSRRSLGNPWVLGVPRLPAAPSVPGVPPLPCLRQEYSVLDPLWILYHHLDPGISFKSNQRKKPNNDCIHILEYKVIDNYKPWTRLLNIMAFKHPNNTINFDFTILHLKM